MRLGGGSQGPAIGGPSRDTLLQAHQEACVLDRPGPRGQGCWAEACSELLGPGSPTVEPFLPPPPPPGTGTVLSCTLPLLDYLQN